MRDKPPRVPVLQPSANPQALLAAVEEALRELEALCGRAERALMLRSWGELHAALADSRRVTHALANAMDDARTVRDAAFDEDVFRRVRYVGAIRENQMARLCHYRDAVGERLQSDCALEVGVAFVRASAHRLTAGVLGSLDLSGS